MSSAKQKTYNHECSQTKKIRAKSTRVKSPNRRKLPQFRRALKVSVEHWTGGYRGFAQPWPLPKELSKEINKKGVSKTLPGLQNFYMVGQWAGGTFGISTVCLMGRTLVRELCKNDKKTFTTNIFP